MDPLESPVDLVRDLRRPAAYPNSPSEVTLLQTHVSWVFFAGDRVYKVKKPVDFGFLDFSTLERRRHFCEEEVRLNRRLAPWIYRGVVPIRRLSDGSLRADGDDGGEGKIVEWAVEMIRLPEERMLTKLLERGEIDNEMMNDLATRLVGFHAEGATGRGVDQFASPDAVASVVVQNLEELQPLLQSRADRPVALELHAFLDAQTRTFLTARRSTFERRVEEGRIREGHGDLHAGNICFTREGIAIYDCIEFSRSLRCQDVACDLAFLAMDLDQRGFPSFGEYLVRRYAEGAGDPGLHEVLGFYKVYRALVRAKVDLLTALDDSLSSEERRELQREAAQYVNLAVATTLRPALVLLCGLPGVGKTWAARALARPMRAALLRSDVRRKMLAGLAVRTHVEADHGAGLYSTESRDRTYRSLLGNAVSLLERGQAVVVDASFSRREWRRSYFDAATRLRHPVYLVHLSASEEVVHGRLAKRLRDPQEASDADLSVYEAERERFEPPTELAPEQVLEISTERSEPEELVSLFMQRRIVREAGHLRP